MTAMPKVIAEKSQSCPSLPKGRMLRSGGLQFPPYMWTLTCSNVWQRKLEVLRSVAVPVPVPLRCALILGTGEMDKPL